MQTEPQKLSIKESTYKHGQYEIDQPVDKRCQQGPLIVASHQVKRAGHGTFHDSEGSWGQREQAGEDPNGEPHEQGLVADGIVCRQKGTLEGEEHA